MHGDGGRVTEKGPQHPRPQRADKDPRPVHIACEQRVIARHEQVEPDNRLRVDDDSAAPAVAPREGVPTPPTGHLVDVAGRLGAAKDDAALAGMDEGGTPLT